MKELRWSALVLTVVLIGIRVVGLSQYPEIHPDEGYWACGPRNLVLFGDGLMDGRLHPFLSPAHLVFLSGWFQLFEPGLVTARWFSAVAGLFTCILVGLLSRRLFPQAPWLFLMLFGLSSLATLVQRIALLEADQMFWLTLAVVFWLSPSTKGQTGLSAQRPVLLAGLAFGVALLVKFNSMYLLPAFLITPAEGKQNETWPRLRATGLFMLVCGLTAGGGYITDWALDPDRFVQAFRYEVDGRHFLDEGVLFQVGRFGLHPRNAWAVLKDLLITDPVLPVLGLAGLAVILHRPRQASRADRIFAAWACFGLAFHFSQIYVAHRYLTTLAPAFAYLATRALGPLLIWPASGVPKRQLYRVGLAVVALVILVVFAAFHAARFTRGLVLRTNTRYWEVVTFVTENVSKESKVLVTPVIGLSLPQQSYDFYRLTRPYDSSELTSLDSVVERYSIDTIVVDSEWRLYETKNMAQFLASPDHCHLLKRFDQRGDCIYTVSLSGSTQKRPEADRH